MSGAWCAAGLALGGLCGLGLAAAGAALIWRAAERRGALIAAPYVDHDGEPRVRRTLDWPMVFGPTLAQLRLGVALIALTAMLLAAAIVWGAP